MRGDDRTTALLRQAFTIARASLLAERQAEGFWRGELSSSALSTATAVGALAMASRERFASLIANGLAWLDAHQNDDGGWGDTPDSPSNIPTTLLAVAAFALGHAPSAEDSHCLAQARRYLHWHVGDAPEARVATLRALYGKDRTFAVPILATCALATEYGSPAVAPMVHVDWPDVPPLPFELACLPQATFRWLRLHVVSYALPALIAIGQLLHAKRPTRNLPVRWLRDRVVARTLRHLAAIQPEGGGFLEAVPLTSFTLMSLAGAGSGDHAVVHQGLEFLQRTVRPDGSWAIDSDLSNWVTSLAVNALAAGGRPVDGAESTAAWLLGCQHTVRHPFTDSAPGGWGWTHLPGGVPDADDTAGTLLALHALSPDDCEGAAADGIRWLLDLQNRNGGWPTFCRGWGRLPFDRSSPDLTAHALRAFHAWRHVLDGDARCRRAIARGLAYLERAQRQDGAWVPLWFGNQHAPDHENPVYGTAKVLLAYRDLGLAQAEPAVRGVDYLVAAQDPDGGWGGARGVASGLEETALAVEALAGWPAHAGAAAVCRRGALHLAERVVAGGMSTPSPIGLYFAKLWYSERLYPIIMAVAALGSVLHEGHTGEAP